MLRPADQEHLDSLGLEHEVVPDGGLIAIVIKRWPVPDGYEPREVDLLLRLPPGFPDAQPDMYWCDPPIRVAGTGAYPQAADLFETYLGGSGSDSRATSQPGHGTPGVTRWRVTSR